MNETTEMNYIMSLSRLEKYGLNINNIDFEILEGICDEKKMNNNVKNLYYSALLWHTKTKNIDDPNVKILRDKIEVTRTEVFRKYLTHELSDNENENFLKWDKIKEIYDMVKANIKTKNDNFNYLLLSLYILTPPRRLDYSNMILDDNIHFDPSDKILWHDNSKNKDILTKKINVCNSTNNYYIRKNDTALFYF